MPERWEEVGGEPNRGSVLKEVEILCGDSSKPASTMQGAAGGGGGITGLPS